MSMMKNRIAHVAEPDGASAPAPPRRRGGRPRLRRRLLWAAAAVALMGLAFLAMRPEPVEVETDRVTRGPLEVAVEEQGVTHVRDRYTVTAPVAGRLLRVGLREGDAVEAGQELARLVPAPADARVGAQAREQLRAARAGLQAARSRAAEALARQRQAERDARRQAALADAGALSEAAREQAALAAAVAGREAEAARAAVAASAAQVGQAEAALVGLEPGSAASPLSVRAPAAGRVLRIADRSERVVAAGTPLLEVGDARALEVAVEVLSQDAVQLRPGTAVRLTGWGGAETIEGRVRTVEPGGFTRVSALGVEEQRVRVVADLVDAPAALADGYRVEAQLVTWSAPEVVRVPVGALFRRGEDWAVFVLDAGRARLRPVRIGHTGAEWAEATAGLSVGDEVVVYPASTLEDGVRARPVVR